MNQTELGEKIGVTYQQLQKYETGANRMGAGRLAAIASALDVPITFFLDQLEARTEPLGEEDAIVLALQDPITVELVRAITAVHDPALKRCVLEGFVTLTLRPPFGCGKNGGIADFSRIHLPAISTRSYLT